MKSLVILPMIFVFLFSILGVVSAQTIIAGKIYNSDYSSTVAGANVTVTCNGNVQNTLSLSDGAYSVTYGEPEEVEVLATSCDSGDSLMVEASHPDYGSGSATGIIHDDMVLTWDVAVVNVPLVPEFGFFVGSLTLVSAIVVFFVVRRK
jgi:hypothetical protein